METKAAISGVPPLMILRQTHLASSCGLEAPDAAWGPPAPNVLREKMQVCLLVLLYVVLFHLIVIVSSRLFRISWWCLVLSPATGCLLGGRSLERRFRSAPARSTKKRVT